MENLKKLQDFAAANDFGLTKPLTHEQVELLANYWAPEIRFYWRERFYPISLDQMLDTVERTFDEHPAEQEDLYVHKFIRLDAHTAKLEKFKPPVVYEKDGTVGFGPNAIRVVRVLNEGTPAREALGTDEIGKGTIISHGADLGRSERFFGSKENLESGQPPAPDNPFLPFPVDADGVRRITVMAALVNIIDLLKYELTVANADDLPPDGLRAGLDILKRLVRPTTTSPSSDENVRQFLLELIEAHEAGGPPPPPPAGWMLEEGAWNAVTRFAFLEFSFFYAYNDFKRYQLALFANEHEGDDEGCCLVFDRNALTLAAQSSEPDALLPRVVPHSIITSVHEEYQDADVFKFIDAPPPGSPDRPARDVVPFTVYAAAGSHATYLTAGTHPLVDLQDMGSYVQENPAILLIALVVPPKYLLALLILLLTIEHFMETEDVTGDEGVHTGPPAVVGPAGGAIVENRVLMLPMSTNNHIYRPTNEELLELRAYPGKWGGHDGIIDKSSNLVPKTWRYFRKLLDKL